jgi:hypothetical protein
MMFVTSSLQVSHSIDIYFSYRYTVHTFLELETISVSTIHLFLASYIN